MAKKTLENNVVEQPKTTRAKRSTKTSSKKGIERRTDDELAEKELQIKTVIENIKMLYNSIKDLREREMYQQISRINVAQEENFSRLVSLDKEAANEIIAMYRTDDKGNLTSRKPKVDRNIIDDTDNMLALINASEEEYEQNVVNEEEKDDKIDVKVEEIDYEIDYNEKNYDIVNLPSNGECYSKKKSKLPVKLLTAADENIITSPALFRDGLIIDCLLRRKIMDKSVDIDSLVMGDVDALTYFLRFTSYGPEFPAKFTDPETNTTFDTIVDLTQIKMKDFKLKGDENGWFEFKLPLSKDIIKFRYTTMKDERKLDKLLEYENRQTKAAALRRMAKNLDTMLDEPGNLIDEDTIYNLENAIPAMEEWAKAIDESEGIAVNKAITNRLELMVMSVNGNTDKKFIKKYVREMLAKDALDLRRYIIENTPGMDFSIRIEKPESLGGGFIDTFLEWDASVFFSIA